jgi:hypothetical protein
MEIVLHASVQILGNVMTSSALMVFTSGTLMHLLQSPLISVLPNVQQDMNQLPIPTLNAQELTEDSGSSTGGLLNK